MLFLIAVLGSATAARAEALKMDRDIELAQMMVTFDKEGVVIPKRTVLKGQPIISMPVTYRRTGILRSDIRFEKSGKVFVRAGAHGFYAGMYKENKVGEGAWAGTPMWCFSEEPDSKKAAMRCAKVGGKADDTGWVAVTKPNTKYLPLFASTRKAKRVTLPDVDEQPASIAPDLTMECKFLGWTEEAVKINCRLGGLSHLGPGVSFPHPLNSDGLAYFKTPVGILSLTRGYGAVNSVVIKEIPAVTPISP